MPRGKSENTVPIKVIERPESQQEFIANLVQRAYDLREEKKVLYKAIDGNRKMIRGLKENGVLNPDEERWVDEFYSPRQTSSEEEPIAA